MNNPDEILEKMQAFIESKDPEGAKVFIRQIGTKEILDPAFHQKLGAGDVPSAVASRILYYQIMQRNFELGNKTAHCTEASRFAGVSTRTSSQIMRGGGIQGYFPRKE